MLKKSVWVAPEHFGPQIRDKIRSILCESVEGQHDVDLNCFILAVLDIKKFSTGKLQDIGDAVYQLEYDALVQQHFKGEVVDAIVGRISPPHSVYFRLGALQVYVRVTEWKYDADAKGFVTASGVSIMKVGTITQVRILQTPDATSRQLIGELVKK